MSAGGAFASHGDHDNSQAAAADDDDRFFEGYCDNRKFARLKMGDIAHLDIGAGPAALFLHGFPLNGFQWRHAVDRLAGHRRCVVPDFLGLGYTKVATGEAVDAEAQLRMLVALLDRLGIASADLVANDSGGGIAQLMMVRHPDRVRSVLLSNCDTEIDSPPPALLPVISLSKEKQWLSQWVEPWYTDKALARSAAGIGGLCYSGPAYPSDVAIEVYFAPMLANARSRDFAHAYAASLDHNPLAGLGSALRQSAIPVRTVWGTADDIFGPQNPAHLETAFGNSRGVRRLEGAKLFWPEERPDIIAAEALQLWDIHK